MHGDHPFPIIRPAIHVLGMRGLEVLDLAKLSTLIHILDEQKLAAIDHRLSHHVLQASLGDKFTDFFAFLDSRRHRHRTHDVLACLERGNAHTCMVANRAIDMNKVDFGVSQNVVEIYIALRDTERIANFMKFNLITPTDRRDIHQRMFLIDGNKLGTKTEADKSSIQYTCFSNHFRYSCPTEKRRCRDSPARHKVADYTAFSSGFTLSF